MKELRAFKQLYQELIDRYNKLVYQDEYFENNHILEGCSLQRLITSYEIKSEFQPIVRDIDKNAIALGLDKLLLMEADLLKLERGNK